MAKMYWGWSKTGGHPVLKGRPIMLSAGVAWNNPGNGFNIHVPETEDLFVDSGGFQATSSWGMAYPYSPREYMDWAERIGADYVALPDFACEPGLHDSGALQRVGATVEAHREAMAAYESGGYSFEPVSVLQGWTVENYRDCAALFKRYDLGTGYMAIGTVCKRRDTDVICEVLATCEDEFPDAEWHLFGLTKRSWKDDRLDGRFRPADTAAWNFNDKKHADHGDSLRDYAADIQALENGQSQTTLVPAADGGNGRERDTENQS